jgi:hypothetical protein
MSGVQSSTVARFPKQRGCDDASQSRRYSQHHVSVMVKKTRAFTKRRNIEVRLWELQLCVQCVVCFTSLVVALPLLNVLTPEFPVCHRLSLGHMCFPTLEIRATMEGVMGGALFRRLRIGQGARSPQSAHVIRQELRYLQYLPKLVDHGQYAWLDHYLTSWLPYGPN